MKSNTTLKVILFSIFSLTMLSAQQGIITPGVVKKGSKHPAYAKVTDDPSLPRVLLIGDSISIGYTAATRKLLTGKANLHRIRENAGNTARGLKRIDQWLDSKNGQWDIIHFNFGLWDLCYRNPKSKNQGNRDKVNGKLTATIEEYSDNLEAIVLKLKRTNATLIFATTTPVPAGEVGRIEGDAVKYNQAALKIMQKHGVIINDLHSAIAPQMQQLAKGRGDVHFKAKGYQLLAQKTSESITEQLVNTNNK